MHRPTSLSAAVLLFPAVLCLVLFGCRAVREPAVKPSQATAAPPRLLLSHFLQTFGTWIECDEAKLSRADAVDVQGIGEKMWSSIGHADSFDNGRWVGSSELRSNGSWAAWDSIGRTGGGALLVDVGLRHDDNTSTTCGALPLRPGASLALLLPNEQDPHYGWVYSVLEAETSGKPGTPCLTCVCLDFTGPLRPAAPAKAWSLRRLPKGASVTGAFSLPARDGSDRKVAVSFTATRSGDSDLTLSCEAALGADVRKAADVMSLREHRGKVIRLAVGGAKAALVFSICPEPGPAGAGLEEPDEEIANRALRLPSSRVTLDVKDARLADVLTELARQSGNRPAPFDPWLADTRVTLAVKDAPYWEAFDALCRASLYSQVECDSKLYGRDESAGIRACAGPAILELVICAHWTGSTLTEYYRHPRDFRHESTAPPSLRFELACAVEDRLPLLGVEAHATSVRTAPGTELLKPRYGPERLWYQPGESRFGFGTLGLEILDAGRSVRGPLTISGRLELLFGIGEKEVRFKDILGGHKQAHATGPFKVALTKAERKGDEIAIALNLDRDLPAALTHEARLAGRYGFKLVGPGGVTCSRMEVGVVESSVDFGGRVSDVTWHISFGPLDAAESEWDLVFTTPERIVERTYPFTLKDIPLPE